MTGALQRGHSTSKVGGGVCGQDVMDCLIGRLLEA